MNVANIEFCRELFELSGWECETTWAKDGKGTAFMCNSDYPDLGHDSYRVAYAYDLGYLLRKLEGTAPTLFHDGKHWSVYPAQERFSDPRTHTVMAKKADTPEDATAKLCVQLFKQGTLTNKGVKEDE